MNAKVVQLARMPCPAQAPAISAHAFVMKVKVMHPTGNRDTLTAQYLRSWAAFIQNTTSIQLQIVFSVIFCVVGIILEMQTSTQRE